ncbi:MAG TPA: hypothetical protein DD640_03405 [Clostridiales bacterium]|nr:hypothetical protein [Clostridiales bacterium]
MRILYGTDQNALRRQCLREVSSLTAAWPDRRAILLVPEQTKMDMERDYLAGSGSPGLMMAEILSFRRLAWRLLGEIGRQPIQAVDSVGQALLIHRVLKKNPSEWQSFSHLADQPGFVRQAAAALGDLKRYQITAAQLLAVSAAVPDIALQQKTHDLGILLREYDLALAETGLGDAEDDLNRLGEALQELVRLPAAAWPWPWWRLDWLRRTSVWVSGFAQTRDFTPQEDAIIKALDQLAADVTLTIASECWPDDSQAVESGADYFLAGRKTAWRLQQIMPIRERIHLPSQLTGLPAEIAACLLGSRRCRLESDPAGRPGGGYLRLVRAAGRDDELAWVAGEIRRLVQTAGYRYRDITVAVCDLPAYKPRLRAVCREYGIPLFLDAERTLTGTPLLRFVLGLLDIGLHNWPLHSIMACLRSGLSPLSLDEIDRLENEMLARGITRPGQLADDSRFSDTSLLVVRDRAFPPWQTFLSLLRQESAGGAKCQILRQFLLDYGLAERLSQRSADLAAAGEMDAGLALVQSWNELNRILDQMDQLLGDVPLSLQSFRDLLAAGMETADSGMIPSSLDQVAAGDLRRAMLRQPRALFLIGATAADLPPGQVPEGLLKDLDRQSLSGLLRCQLPSKARDQAFSDAFMILTLLTMPTGRLYLTAPETAVSTWFSWLAAAAPRSAVQLPEQPVWPDARLHALRPAFGYFLQYCCRQAAAQDSGRSLPDPAARAAESAAESDVAVSDWPLLACVLRDAGLPLEPAASWLGEGAKSGLRRQVSLPPELVRSLYADPVVLSVSQLEHYAGCPFLHLGTSLLSLREREVWQPEAAEMGTLLHGILELAVRELGADLQSLAPADREGRMLVLQQWLQSDLAARILNWQKLAADRNKLNLFFDTGLRASAGRRAKRLAQASLEAILRQLLRESYRPVSLEWSFGPGQPERWPLRLADGTRLELRGMIDRIDLLPDESNTRFRIIDYKSGNKYADPDALYHGLELQLPAYLEAYSRNNPGLVADDAAYFHFDRPMLSLSGGARPLPELLRRELDKRFNLHSLKMTPDQLDLLRRHTLRRISDLSGQLLAGRFDVAPRKLPRRDPPCRYCSLHAVCGFDDQPAGYVWLPQLAGRPTGDGKRLNKREELVCRLQEQENREGGAEHAAHS